MSCYHCWDCECGCGCSCHDPQDHLSTRKRMATGHVMNKNEAKLCRKLMSETGKTEEELRKDKKYRKMLSEAQKEGQKPKRTRLQKARDKVMKTITRRLKLPKEHPDVINVYVDEWEMLRKKYAGFDIWNDSIYNSSCGLKRVKNEPKTK